MTMSSSNILSDYVTGWLDSTVHDFLETSFAPSSNTKFALITCLDSNLQPADMLASSPELSALKPDAQTIGSALLVPTSTLLRLPRVFYGFDEVWFFPSKDVLPKPSDFSLVGPKRIDPVRLQVLEPWMTSQRASLGHLGAFARESGDR
jgi:hypothetical protein